MALGIVLTPYGGKAPRGQVPWEMAESGPDNWPQLRPFDPQYNTMATPGFYYDTPLGLAGLRGNGAVAGAAVRVTPKRGSGVRVLRGLGAIPTDAELARDRCATPVMSGWIPTSQGFVPPPWVPGIGPGPGLGEGTAPATGLPIQPTPPLPTNFDPVAAEERHRQRMFLLQVVSVTAVVAVSLVNFYRAAKAIKQDRV